MKRILSFLGGIGATFAVGALLLAPTQSGACSYIDACEELTSSEVLTQLTVTKISGEGEVSPEWLSETAELTFDGWGSPSSIEFDDTTLRLTWSQ